MDWNNMPKLTGILISLYISLLSLPAFAADSDEAPDVKYYDVEIVIFKNIKVPKGHEFKLPTPSATRTENTLDLSDPKSIKRASQRGFIPLSSDELRLQDSVDKIIRSSRYGLLTHTGWRQPGLDEKNSIPVWIKGGKIFDNRYSSIDQVTQLKQEDQNLQKKDTNTQPKYISARGLYELEGLITITLSRYLHTKAELVLRKPADTASILQQVEPIGAQEQQEMIELEGQLLLNYGLDEQRRMRSKKLHYLDHPEFGMLVLITPYEPPPPEATTAIDSTVLDTSTTPVPSTE
jgi:hypothetical protein